MKAVELKNVTFAYDGGAYVFEDIHFYARYGEISLVAGHSGQGKSTLLSIISGIIPNVYYGDLKGRVEVGGQSIFGLKLGDICRKVGVVLQDADQQIVHKEVGDEIAFGCENLAFPPHKIEKQIEIVCKLTDLKPEWKTQNLSGGQKQKLITASTLAMGQRIIILDEPLAHLDTEGAILLMSTLKSLAAAGYCVIVSEHRLDAVLPHADRVWHVGGKKVAEAADKSLYLRQQSVAIEDGCPVFTGTQPIITLERAAFSMKGKEILTDITCEIPANGRTVFLGENGSGKTTLMRLIARLYKPTDGKISQYIDPQLSQKPKGSRAWFKKVGVVYQNPDYQLFMPTVEQEIAFGAPSKEYADTIMDMFGLTKLACRHPHSLSQGQKRKVSIAAVAACRPRLLLLDEPTVGQDYEGLCELVQILNTLHQESANSMVTITHDMRCAQALCDKAVLLSNGKIIEQGGKDLVKRYFAIMNSQNV